jgi:predicted DNA-binding protein with PD1-like motif
MAALNSRLDRRLVRHPGRPADARYLAESSPNCRTLRLTFAPGISLLEGIVLPLQREKITSAVINLLGGPMERIEYCMPADDTTGHTVATYGEPGRERNGFFLGGTATLGLAVDGLPFIHCHGSFVTEAGELRGGHIVTEKTIVGPTPLTAFVRTIETFIVQLSEDSETNHRVFHPRSTSGAIVDGIDQR